MEMNMTEQTAKDIAKVVDILDTRQHELGGIVGACPREVEALVALKAAAQGTLEAMRGKA